MSESAPTSWRDRNHPLHHLWAWVLAFGLMNLIAWRLEWPFWVL